MSDYLYSDTSAGLQRKLSDLEQYPLDLPGNREIQKKFSRNSSCLSSFDCKKKPWRYYSFNNSLEKRQEVWKRKWPKYERLFCFNINNPAETYLVMLKDHDNVDGMEFYACCPVTGVFLETFRSAKNYLLNSIRKDHLKWLDKYQKALKRRGYGSGK